jgi:SCY1-like protein 2
MESMLNKLKSTVTKVTADVTSAVMGNPVTREFDVGRHIASGGNGLAWKIFNGTKKSTKQVSYECNLNEYTYEISQSESFSY